MYNNVSILNIDMYLVTKLRVSMYSFLLVRVEEEEEEENERISLS